MNGHGMYVGIAALLLILSGAFIFFDSTTARQFIENEYAFELVEWPRELDVYAYNQGMLDLAHHVASTTATSTVVSTATTSAYKTDAPWPAPGPYPHGEALLPFNRIVAYYGNFYSTRMGILGEFEPEVVKAKLLEQIAEWEVADPDTPVIPAAHYIAMVAQGSAGEDGMYRAVMPDEEIEKAYQLARELNGVLFIDLQIGLSDIEVELPKFQKFLKRPDVHLGIDPEFAMADGDKPGTVIGRYEAEEINFVSQYLADLVHEYQLPPKVLAVHRFTDAMVQDVEDIVLRPEVQVVIHMDGWGSKDLKRGTYRQVVEEEPLQFAGLKIFYKNDLKPPSTGIFTPEEALELYPKPIYIQYQ